MIRITVRRNGAGAVTGLDVTGHAGYAEHGRDIVCAAVSALAQTAVLGLERLGADFSADEARGRLSVELHRETDPVLSVRAEDVLETAVLGLTAIARRHGRFVTVREAGREGK